MSKRGSVESSVLSCGAFSFGLIILAIIGFTILVVGSIAAPYILTIAILAGIGAIALCVIFFIFWLFFKADFFPD